MKIRHERPSPDLAFEVRAPLMLELMTGERVTVDRWSLEGITFPCAVDLPPREAVLTIPFQGVDIRFGIRLKPTGQGGVLAFDGLTGRQRETLAVFYRSLLSGRMAATEEVITSLDAPVDLVPMGETEEEEAEGRAKRAPRALRAALSLGAYLLVAALVLATLTQGVVSRLAVVDIRNARIEAPMSEMLALQPGYVREIAVAPGDAVAAGDVLVRVTLPEAEADLTAVRARIAALEARRAELVAERGAEALPPTRAVALRLQELERALAGVDADLRRLRRERGRLRGAADALHLVADAPGRVVEVLVREGQYLARGLPALRLEGARARVARGWIGQEMAAALAPGMDATVRVHDGTGPVTLEGRIEAVTAGIDPGLSPEFGMLVTVAFPALTADETRARLPDLMPVAVTAKRGWARRAEGWLAGLRARAGL